MSRKAPEAKTVIMGRGDVRPTGRALFSRPGVRASVGVKTSMFVDKEVPARLRITAVGLQEPTKKDMEALSDRAQKAVDSYQASRAHRKKSDSIADKTAAFAAKLNEATA